MVQTNIRRQQPNKSPVKRKNLESNWTPNKTGLFAGMRKKLLPYFPASLRDYLCEKMVFLGDKPISQIIYKILNFHLAV